MTLEEHFEELEQIIHKMEDGSANLDESFELYKQGLNHVKEANRLLDDMEKAMLVLAADGSLQKF